MSEWSNWSGSVLAKPSAISRPKTMAELSSVVAAARKVRVVGAGHSFMPLCETDDVLISLADMDGEVEVNADRTRASAPAGMSLKQLTKILWDKGASLANQGDVNPQSLAGATSTGTHGTGASLGSLSTLPRAFELIMHDGSVVRCSETENPDLFQAQRLSVGLLGVAARIEFDILPAYHLEERLETVRLGELAERWPDLAAQNRHAEFFIFPYCDVAMLKVLHPKESEGEMPYTTDFDEKPFRRLCDICAAAPFLTRFLQSKAIQAGTKKRRVGPAYQIFPSERTIRFEEMEYELPRENGWPALREVIAHVQRNKLPVTFPLEFRLVAADDIWLSPFNGRDGASISFHQYAKMKWREIFLDVEKIFRSFDGRPHWAKRHTMTNTDLHALYPMAERFCAERAKADPVGKFANAHLADLFDIH
ncbi:MAG: D-arabinono-1,4-lactone oxidase [Hyphomonadaceae bacterium]